MKVIAVISPCGGTGRTTMTASLATILQRQNWTTGIIELDPANRLGLFLGLNELLEQGFAAHLAKREKWCSHAYQSADQVIFLPFGAVDAVTKQIFDHALYKYPQWLKIALHDIVVPPDSVFFIDTPPWPSLYVEQACEAADLIVVVWNPEPLHYLTLSAVSNFLAKIKKPALFLVNKLDVRRPLHNDLVLMSQNHLANLLLPYRLHLDEAVPEAFANNKLVIDHAPSSQVSHDLHGISAYIMQTLDKLDS